MSCACHIALNSNVDIDPTSPNCGIAAGKNQHALKVAGCTPQNVDQYCSGNQVGQCPRSIVRRRAYPSGNSKNGFQFGANCPDNSVGLLVDDGKGNKYSPCAPIKPSTFGTECPVNSMSFSTGTRDLCLWTCNTDDQCSADQTCIPHSKADRRGFCLGGPVDTTNTFYSNDTVKNLFEHDNCKNWDDCKSCLNMRGIDNPNQQKLFCPAEGNPGMFYTVNLDKADILDHRGLPPELPLARGHEDQ